MQDFEQEFPLNPEIAYLNHAGVAPWPLRTEKAVCAFARENVVRGAQHYPAWICTEALLREQLRELINAPQANDIALLKNTSEGLSIIAYGLPWSAGDNIVITDSEFPSNRIVWESIAQKFGVQLRKAALSSPYPEGAIVELIDSNTRIVSVSSIQYGSGLALDLEVLGETANQFGALFCVDAIQSLGAMTLDAQAIQADFIVADGHKWMLGPEGVALFYSTEAAREKLDLKQYGWHMVEMLGDYDRESWAIASSARRFECGSPNMLGIHGLSASLSLLLEVGIPEVERRIRERTDYLCEHIAQTRDYTLISPHAPRQRGGIVSFRHRSIPSGIIFNRLREMSIICAERQGNIRFSPHFYTRRQDLDRALSALEL